MADRESRSDHALHWLIAAIVHVPIVYAVLAITVRNETATEEADTFADEGIVTIITDPSEPVIVRDYTTPARMPPPRSSPLAPPSGVPTLTVPETPALSAPGSAVQRMMPATPLAAGLMPRANSSAPAPPIEIARARVATQLVSVNDSITEAKRAKQDADDMTVTDRNGNRWGMSRGALHLGDKTIRLAYATNGGPVPDLIVPSPGRRDEVNATKRNWLEIEMQSSRALVNRTFDQRATEMRQRRDSTRINTLATGTTTKRRNQP